MHLFRKKRFKSSFKFFSWHSSMFSTCTNKYIFMLETKVGRLLCKNIYGKKITSGFHRHTCTKITQLRKDSILRKDFILLKTWLYLVFKWCNSLWWKYSKFYLFQRVSSCFKNMYNRWKVDWKLEALSQTVSFLCILFAWIWCIKWQKVLTIALI